LLTHIRWDDWVTEDRLRKFDDEGKELAQSLKREFKASQQEREAQITKTKSIAAQGKRKSGKGSDFGSVRDSEEPKAAQAQTQARGTKRGRDWEIEKVCGVC